MLVKNMFSIENIKNPDFGILELLLSYLESNIKSIRSVSMGEGKKHKVGKHFFGGSQDGLKSHSFPAFEHKTNDFGWNLDNGHLIFPKSAQLQTALCSQRPQATITASEAKKKSTFETIDFPN